MRYTCTGTMLGAPCPWRSTDKPCPVHTPTDASATVDGVRLSVHRLPHPDAEGRSVYRWAVGDMAQGEDLRTGVRLDHGPQAMLGTLASFLGACGESYPDGENADLFSPAVARWAAEHTDDLAMLSYELEGE